MDLRRLVPPQVAHRPEGPEKLLLAFGPNAGDLVQHGLADSFPSQAAMEGDGKSVGFISNCLKQVKGRGRSGDKNRGGETQGGKGKGAKTGRRKSGRGGRRDRGARRG